MFCYWFTNARLCVGYALSILHMTIDLVVVGGYARASIPTSWACLTTPTPPYYISVKSSSPVCQNPIKINVLFSKTHQLTDTTERWFSRKVKPKKLSSILNTFHFISKWLFHDSWQRISVQRQRERIYLKDTK